MRASILLSPEFFIFFAQRKMVYTRTKNQAKDDEYMTQKSKSVAD
jgi:hypothetical protein